MYGRYLLLLVMLGALGALPVRAQYLNGDSWPDVDGRHINAHGGCLLSFEGCYYWYGECWDEAVDGRMAGVSVYASRDLQTWQNKGIVLPVSALDGTDGKVCLTLRPRVLYNERTKQFVLLFHQTRQGGEDVRLAFAVSDTPTGPFRLMRSEQPHADRWPQAINPTFTLFADEDGRAYYVTASATDHTLLVSELSDDYLSLTSRCTRTPIGAVTEAPCLFRHGDRYWLLCSGEGAQGAGGHTLYSARNLFSPWQPCASPFEGKALRNHDLPAEQTFGAQGTAVFPLCREGHTTLFLMADLWDSSHPQASRHLWLPIRFAEDGTPRIPWSGLLPEGIPVPTEYPEYDVTLRTLLEEMSDVTAHAKWPVPAYTCRQTSSYSRESKTPDTAVEDGTYRPASGRDWAKGWFDNHDFGHFYGQQGKEFVLLDTQGPGAVVDIWTAYGDGSLGTFRFYLDGDTVPVIEGDMVRLAGGEELVSYPFSYRAPGKTENSVWHGNNLILPIPYANGCKITYEPYREGAQGGLYYQINYRNYEAGTRVRSFDRNTLKEYERAIYDCGVALTGNHNLANDDRTRHKAGVLKTGHRQTLRLKGERCITSLTVQIAAEDQPEALAQTWIRMRFDGEQTVDCPTGAFFGIGRRQLAHSTFYVKTQAEGLMTVYWVMPFAQEAEVSLVNQGAQDVEVKHFLLTSQPAAWDEERSMLFHATYRETKNIDTNTKFDYNYVTIHGRGRYVGDGLFVQNYMPDYQGWWGEGDEKIFVDGESFPSHFGTGTEDYYRYAYCRPQPFCYPNISQPIGEGNKTPGVTQNNRYRLLDDIPFAESLAFYMEIWHPFYRPMDYAPATFWYGDPGCSWEMK